MASEDSCLCRMSPRERHDLGRSNPLPDVPRTDVKLGTIQQKLRVFDGTGMF